MNKEKIVDKIKHFWNDTEAISPIIATIMVLVVAVASGAGLYFWFDEFQEGAQDEVGVSATSNVRAMVIGSADVKLNPLSEKTSFDGMDAPGDTAGNGDGWIFNALSSTLSYDMGPNGRNDKGWIDERFIVEIPITIISNAELNNVVLTAMKPVAIEGDLRDYMWLHLDRDTEYQLNTVNDEAFVGYINKSYKVYEDTSGYTYYFGGMKHLGLDMINGNVSPETGTLADNTSTSYPDESNLDYPNIPTTDGSLSVITLYKDDGNTRFAFAKNGTADLGWITCNYNASETTTFTDYFNGDKLKPVFDSGTYTVADQLTANKVVTVYAYFMVDVLAVDTQSKSAEIELPFRVTTDEGVMGTTSVTLTVTD